MRTSLNLYLATLWLVSLKGVAGGGLPRVWWQPGTAVKEGDTIELQCQVASVAAGPAIWLKLDPHDPNGHEILSHGDLIVTEDPRISALYLEERNVYVVKIQEVSAADAGSYQCQVPVSSDEEEERVEAAPPVVVTLLTSSAPPASLSHAPSLLLLLLLVGLLVGGPR